MAPRELNGDVTAEFLLRIPPDEPADLVRASAVCKLWLHVASDPTFLRRYRAFHRGAPLLGFFHNPDSVGSSFPGFVSTTAASSPPQPWHRTWVRRLSDCRHGRVLLETGNSDFAVWEPLSNHWEEVKVPSPRYTCEYNAVVLCAMPGCDHSSCRGGPFHVVSVRANSGYNKVRAHVYSSESRSWKTTASSQLDGTDYFFDRKRAFLIGGGVYCSVDDGERILKYDLVKHRFSLIDVPPYHFRNAPVLMQNEDGSLGIAGVLFKGSRIHIWSAMVNAEGVVTGWVKQRVINLKKILPVGVTCDQANVICFAEGVDVFFINTDVGAFTYELKSGRVRKVGIPRQHYVGINPFISFFTPDLGCSKWTK